MKKKFKIFLITFFVFVSAVFIFSYSFKIDTDYYCCESPTVRWKFAIYCGECDDETGCHYIKLEDTGILEYFGFREVNCKMNK